MERVRATLLWAVLAVVLLLLARGLPQRTFVVGDPGLKLIAARNAIEHPARPFEIDLPRVGGRPVDFVDPSFRVHGDHAHAATSEFFPVMTAAFIAAFGISGAFVLAAAAVTCSLLVLLTAPNDGGGQWGPRYLLFAFIPVSILTADALAATVRRPHVVGMIAVAVVAASLMVQRSAYKNLHGTKHAYGRLLEFVERGTSPGGYVVTDLWWFEQVTAALYPTRTVLFVDSSASARRALALLLGESNVSVVRSERESPPDSLDSWLDGTGFVVGRQTTSRERALVLSGLVKRQ
jgi:hypothetical protein